MAIELIRGLKSLTEDHKGCVVTIGNFDGVHVGHQALLKKVKLNAQVLQLPSLVMTFEPQPYEFFAKGECAPRLTRWHEKLALLNEAGIDRLLIVKFDEKFAELTAEQFVQQILVDALDVKSIVVGDDFHFGHAREGDFTFLTAVGRLDGFTVENTPSVMIDNERVSSTRVRKALASADHELVGRLLGRPYSLQGRIIYGEQRGRTMGFPTANITLQQAVVPVHGVYAVRMHGLTGEGLPGVANVGVRPTVDGTRCMLEVHLFDFDEEIYGQRVRVEFCEKLRDEKRFSTIELLKAQIGYDAKRARDYFETRGELG